MADRRMMTMNWDDLGAPEDDDDHFFESLDRISVSSAARSGLAASSSSDDDEFEDGRMSFASAYSSSPSDDPRPSFAGIAANNANYDIWTGALGSITERRHRLLQGMGLSAEKELLRIASNGFSKAPSNKIRNCKVSPLGADTTAPTTKASKQEPSPSPSSPSAPTSPFTSPVVLVRSRSDGDIGAFSIEKERRKSFIGEVSKQRLTRTFSTAAPCARVCCHGGDSVRISRREKGGDSSSIQRSCRNSGALSSVFSNGQFGAFFLIKNLDTGKEFIVNEYDQHGMWNRFSDLQTGKQLTMEEFEKCVGFSPVVKELMRRENISRMPSNGMSGERKGTAGNANANSYLSKSFRYSKRRGSALLKNIKGVANTMSGLMVDKERENSSSLEQKSNAKNSSTSSRWTKVRQHGKSHKELTALHLCQDIQAHEGSIWAIRFSFDARYLASAGEDRVIHVWEVQECEIMSMRWTDEFSASSANLGPNSDTSSSDRPSLLEAAALLEKEKKKKGKNNSTSRKGGPIPDYVYTPETVFSLSDKPAFTFKGHLDDVLDLSWSKSQLLLSSSMDKTVRLWDMDTQCCLKLFAHNDYVTCIQFNPADDDYFISGSLDAKVRIWSIPDRQVVDWSDLHEMVTAACYTPDGQGALIGSHKGSCRLYSTADCKLISETQFDIQNKKKAQAKKITGFQFAPGGNSSEVLVTSADSRVRIYEGSEMVSKFKGFRNTSSQIAASFSTDGKYIICASEDSHVYVWKRPENGSSCSGTAKSKTSTNTRSHEFFQCRDVSAAVPWPGTLRGDPPPPELLQFKRQSKRAGTSTPQSKSSSPTMAAEDAKSQSKRAQLPPLPKKSACGPDKCSLSRDDDLSAPSRVDSGIGESFNSAPSSGRYGESPSISASGNLSSSSWSGSFSGFDGGSSRGGQGSALTTTSTAWGMVIVTATLGGEIRAYQNFGLPVRMGRQTTLFPGT